MAGLLQPSSICWGIARDFPVAVVIAIPTLAGTSLRRRIIVSLLVKPFCWPLWAWFAFTTYYITTLPTFSGHVQEASIHLEAVSKIFLMTFVTILLVNSSGKLRLLVLVIIASFGLRALFAAIFFVKTGGQFKI